MGKEGGKQGAGADRELLLKKLSSWNRRESAEAEKQIRAMGSEGVDLLLAYLRHEEPKRIKRQIWGQVMFVLLMFPVNIGIAALVHSPKLVHFGFVYIVGISVLVGIKLGTTRDQKQAAIFLSSTDDIRATSSLLEAIDFPGKANRRVIIQALLRLLPRMQRDNANLLNGTQRLALDSLTQNSNSDLVMAAIKAIEQVGTSDSIYWVQLLADGKGLAGKNELIKKAAQVCLLSLKARNEEINGEALLIPASQPTAHPDTLLRPVTGVVNTEPAQLLRASIGENADVEKTTRSLQ